MTDTVVVVTWVVVITVIAFAYPFVILLTAKLAAWGWYRGRYIFTLDCKNQEKQDGDKRKEETEKARACLRQKKS